MKIGILTFSAAVNYGAILQTYALKDVLERMGHDVSVIDYQPDYFKNAYSILQSRPGFRSLASIEGLRFWQKYLRGCNRRAKRNKKFRQFSNQYLNLTPIDRAAHFDAIVCGSDQIWNPTITDGKLDPIFFGMTPALTTDRRIAYAGSIRSMSNLEGFRDEFIGLLHQMDAVSAREANVAQQINEWSPDLKVEHVVDPTLLAGTTTFEKLVGAPLVEKPYLLFFHLNDDATQREYARKIAKTRNLELIEVSTYHESVKGATLFDPVSPSGFCTLVKYASFVISDSFHATAFSILFDKPFLVLEAYKGMANRITSLLDLCRASNRLINREDVIRLSIPDLSICETNVDHTHLEKQRDGSLRWLRATLK